MPAGTQSPETSGFQLVDEEEGKMRQVTKGIESIEQKAESGATVIEGYIATKGVDRANDFYTENALQEMADQLNQEIEQGNADIKTLFPEFDEEDLEQIKQNYSANGNVDHYNNPAFPMGDPRIVSAYKIVDAEYDGFGLKIRAELNEDLPFGVPEAIKAALEKGYLDGFSVEFVARRATNVMKDGRKVRKIMSALYTGAALTGRPIQTAAAVTDAEFKSAVGQLADQEGKSMHWEDKAAYGDEVMEQKASVAGVTFRGTRGGKLDESRIPNDDYESHYLFPDDTKSDSSYPVVDGDGFLRSGNVEAAFGLGARGGVTEDELHGKLSLLNKEFESPPIDPEKLEKTQENKSFINGSEELEGEKAAWQELKNDITGAQTMPEDEPNEPEQDSEPEQGEDQENVEEQEGKSQAQELKEELEEVRQEIKSVVKENEELRSEKEELEQKFEDVEGIQEVKSDIDELKQELKNVNPENTPQQDTDETRDDQVSEQESKSALEQQLENYGNPRNVIADQNMKSAIAERHGVTEDEVEEAADKVA